MLLLEPLVYYEEILKIYKNSFLAEDDLQVIIGIDCSYISGENIDELRDKFNLYKTDKIAPFAGFFGVTSYDIVKTMENIGKQKESYYKFPNFYYANAKSYIHYDKISKIYTFYGDCSLENKLLNVKEKNKKKEYKFKILTDFNKEKDHFVNMVKKAKKYIENGDVFQVVLGEILRVKTNLSSLEFYKKLKLNNKSPYMFHFPTIYGDVVGSSPELVFEIKDDNIFVAPIAGTRKRGFDANEDNALKMELLSDEKELAEHKMLIDLARNDIGKYAKVGSVRVSKPMEIVFYESVMHIVSEVWAKKDKNSDNFDIFCSIFPAGTLSGSPKIRAMQIIDELELKERKIYGGAIGFWHFNEDVQMAILIRSAMFSGGIAYIGAGAGIVYDSILDNEYKEICNKRNSCLKVIKELCKEENDTYNR